MRSNSTTTTRSMPPMLLLSTMALCLLAGAEAFVPAPFISSSSPAYRSLTRHYSDNMDMTSEFRLFNGEIVNPYKTLKVDRDATSGDVKDAYRKLCFLYHPDAQYYERQGMLPGSCNNFDDVREHWERVQLSYRILKNKRLRARYNRYEVMNDPGAAVGRAALGAVGNGIAMLGSGIFAASSWGLEQLNNHDDNKEEETTSAL